MNYRRALVPGGSYFFIVATERRSPLLAIAENIVLLRGAIRHVLAFRPFDIDAIVVLPERLHSIWTLPPGDSDFSTRWRLIKTWFTKHCIDVHGAAANEARRRKEQQAIWRHCYWEHLLKDQEDFNRHVDYIHYNPVKHGHGATAAEWPYSSFHRAVRLGIYPPNWCVPQLTIAGDEPE